MEYSLPSRVPPAWTREALVLVEQPEVVECEKHQRRACEEARPQEKFLPEEALLRHPTKVAKAETSDDAGTSPGS